MDEIAISCRGIKKSYGTGENRYEALRGIDLEICKGQLTLLVGPSGSGKTTLLSIISTILTPDEGQLFLLGHEVSQMNDRDRAEFCRNNLGIVFQSLFLVPTLTVAENVGLPLMIANHSEQEVEERALQLLNQLDLDHRASMSPSSLSKGQQQRVAIARAMINDADIVVCDEPTSALDHVAGAKVMSLLHNLTVHSSKCVLVVTHDHRTFPYADRIIKMGDGKIIVGEEDE